MATNRYDFPNNINIIKDGKKTYKTIFYPEVLESENDIFIFSKQGDRLDLLAHKYYGDATKWWIIAHANKIKGTFILPRDIQLRIPMNISQVLNNLKDINS